MKGIYRGPTIYDLKRTRRTFGSYTPTKEVVFHRRRTIEGETVTVTPLKYFQPYDRNKYDDLSKCSRPREAGRLERVWWRGQLKLWKEHMWR